MKGDVIISGYMKDFALGNRGIKSGINGHALGALYVAYLYQNGKIFKENKVAAFACRNILWIRHTFGMDFICLI